MLQRYRFRIYPSPVVRQRLAVAFGCARRVYTDGLQARIDAFDAGRPFMMTTGCRG